jgi:hypothetical protein
VWCQNCQCSKTNRISCIANNQSLIPGEIGNLSPVLSVLGIAVRNSCYDFILDGLTEVLDGSMNDSGSLAGMLLVKIFRKSIGWKMFTYILQQQELNLGIGLQQCLNRSSYRQLLWDPHPPGKSLWQGLLHNQYLRRQRCLRRKRS